MFPKETRTVRLSGDDPARLENLGRLVHEYARAYKIQVASDVASKDERVITFRARKRQLVEFLVALGGQLITREGFEYNIDGEGNA